MIENTKDFRFILDTNVLFSAIRYRGKPFELLEEAEKKNIEIIVPEYVYEELRIVFERNGIDFDLVKGFLSTYTNISIVEREFSDDFIGLAKSVVKDRKDRPIFILCVNISREQPFTYLVTGDKALRDVLNEIEEGSTITVDEALKMVLSK
ncbi:MAG: PIN domain-containing protein [Archaeoglobus sp.]|uniref:PIN domain-containing protein n=1 Tax=Archaeoglobus sp. TaxID=1872626 RepID=UPI001D3C0C67|nr:PIN domain-containing protein [Archaeoglobus sp.]MBO8180990.1 PIN domain-containing protein [Archaeoglobus sp.]